jgi:hypothetical protein
MSLKGWQKERKEIILNSFTKKGFKHVSFHATLPNMFIFYQLPSCAVYVLLFLYLYTFVNIAWGGKDENEDTFER